ncbi:unnamed protein product [Closterium sp. NIES-53]
MEVARTSMVHAAASHFLWPFAVRYAAHQLNLWPRVSLLKTSPTLRWTGKVGDASLFWVWGSRAFVRDTSTNKLSSRASPCVFLGFPPDAPGWQFYHPTSCHAVPSQDIMFDESVPFNRPPPVDPLPPQGPAPSGVSQVDPIPLAEHAEVTVDSRAACGGAKHASAEPGGAEPASAEPGGAEPASAEPGGAEPEGAEPGGAESEGAESGGAEPEGAEPGGIEPEGAEPGGAESEGAESGGAEPRARTCLRSGAARAGGPAAGGTGAGGAGGIRPGGAGVIAGAGGTGGAGAAGPGGAQTRGTGGTGAGGVGGAGAGDPGAGGTGAGDPGAGGTCVGGAGAGGTGAGGAAGAAGPGGALTRSTGAAGAGGVGGTEAGGTGAGGARAGAGGTRAGGAGARGAGGGGAGAGGARAGGTVAGGAGAWGAGAGGTGARGTVQRRPFFVPPPPSSLPPPDLVLRQVLNSLTERREPESHPTSLACAVCTGRRVPHSRPPPILGTHIMALRPSSVPLQVPLSSPPASSLADDPDPKSGFSRAARPTVTRLLAIVVTGPSFESTAASAVVPELVDFAAACRLDYAASLVAESESDCPPSVGGECALGTKS